MFPLHFTFKQQTNTTYISTKSIVTLDMENTWDFTEGRQKSIIDWLYTLPKEEYKWSWRKENDVHQLMRQRTCLRRQMRRFSVYCYWMIFCCYFWVARTVLFKVIREILYVRNIWAVTIVFSGVWLHVQHNSISCFVCISAENWFLVNEVKYLHWFHV